jgi:hypothetical protein
MNEADANDRGPSPDARRAASSADNPWVVLACLFFAAGALGIPLIWVSRAFSRPVKIALTVAVTLYTALMLWLVWLVVLAYYHYVVNSL